MLKPYPVSMAETDQKQPQGCPNRVNLLMITADSKALKPALRATWWLYTSMLALGLFLILIFGVDLPAQFNFTHLGRENLWNLAIVDMILSLPGKTGDALRVSFLVSLGACSLSLMVLSLDKVFISISSIKNLVARALGRISIWNAVLLSLYSALAEEILFRGALQTLLGLPIALGIYLLMHSGPHGILSGWTIQNFILGSGMSVLFHLTQNLPFVIMIHFVINLVSFIQLRREFNHFGEAAFLRAETSGARL